MTSDVVSEKLFAVLGKDGKTYRVGSGLWALPCDGEAGAWMLPIEGSLIGGGNGYHLCREQDLPHWLGPSIYEAEWRAERRDCSDRVMVREARLLKRVETWNKRVARLFACDCVGHVLSLFEGHCPNDSRPRRAIAVARQYAEGTATRQELSADGCSECLWEWRFELRWHQQGAIEKAIDWVVGRGAAWHAARNAAWNVARAAGDLTRKRGYDAAREASLYAAIAVGNATGMAGYDLGWLPACKVEDRWQGQRLMEYLYG